MFQSREKETSRSWALFSSMPGPSGDAAEPGHRERRGRGQQGRAEQVARPDGLFRVLVEPAPGKPAWPDRAFVRLGGKVHGWVQGETVLAGYELWRQLNDFPLDFGQGATAPAAGGPASGDGRARGRR